MAHKVPAHELHRVVATCIIYDQDRKFLIGRRPSNARIFPDKWGVPGGGISRNDYEHLPFSLSDGWHDPIDPGLRREITQEVGIEVGSFRYMGNFSHIRPDGIAVLGLRFAAPYKSGEVTLSLREFAESAWVSVCELPKYDFMGGIVEAIQQVDGLLMRENVRGRAAL